MSEEFKVRFTTLAEGEVLDLKAHLVTLPSVVGEVGILAEHCPYIFKLASGTVKVFGAHKSLKKQVEIEGGIARFDDNTLSIISDEMQI